MTRRHIAFGLVLGVLAWLSASAAVAQGLPRIAVRAWDHGPYGRIVFDWPGPVGYQARIEGNTLTVQFDRRLVPSLTRVFRNLPDYVSQVGMAGGGQVLRFQLTEPFELRSFVLNNAVVVDLLRVPPDTADVPGIVGGPGLTTLPLRFGGHPGFSRIVFDWSRNVGYGISQQGNRVTVGFDQPARVDLRRVASALPRFMSDMRANLNDGRLAVSFAIPDNSKLRNFRVGSRVVVDVLAPDPDAPPEPPVEAVEAPPATDEPPDTPPADTTAAAVEPDTAPSPPGETAAAPSDDTADVPAEPAAPGDVALGESMPAETEELPPIPPDDPQAPPAVDIDESTLSPPGMVAGVLTLDVTRDDADGGAQLRFDWDAPVAAAVFTRAGQLWVVFDAPADIDFARLALDPSVISGGVQVPMEGRTIAVFGLERDVRATVSRDDLSWVIDLAAGGGATTALNVVVEEASEVGRRIRLPGENFGGEIFLIDPEVGDRLIVVPVLEPGHGVDPARQYVDLELLRTAQGVVVRPISDSVAVRSLRDGVEVTSLDGLRMATAAERRGEGPGTMAEGESPESTIDMGGLELVAPETADGSLIEEDTGPLFDFRAWRRVPGKSYLDSLQAHNLNLALATEDVRPDARRALARFNFANGFMPEALGWIEQTVSDAPWLDRLAEIRAMRAAANVLMGRLPEAEIDLFDEVFDSSREVALWRGSYLVQADRADEADIEFIKSERVIERYPLKFRSQLRLQAVEAALAARRIDRAENIIDMILAEEPRQEIVDRTAFYQGIVLAASDRPVEAIDMLEQPAQSKDRQTRLRAGRARIELMLNQGMITPDEAIEGLEMLRFAWRGDDLELKLLRRLGELHAEVGDYAESLAVNREAITVFPESPEAREIAQAMNQTFQELFLDGLADPLPPITALGIYYDFRELTPPGNLGDQLIFRLADRLVAVDLLEEAAGLLQHQVEFRLRGPELSRVGARLAEIYMLDGKPERAVAALRASDTVEIDEGLKQQRHYLLGHALAKAGDHDRVLALLSGDQSREANLLRAEVYWAMQDWIAEATILEQLLRDRGTADPLDAQESQQMTRLAISLALANNRQALAELRDSYATLMDRTPNGSAFRAITSYVDGGPIDPTNLAGAVAEIDTYEAFMAGLRERVTGNNLSAIN